MKHLVLSASILALFAVASAPAVRATSVTLDGFETTAGINANNITSLSIINDGINEVMQGTSTTTDPQIVIPNIMSGLHAVFDTNVFTQVQLSLYVDPSVTTNLVLFYDTAASPGLSGTKSVTVDTSSYRGQYHTYTVNMASAPNWTGSYLTTLRIDPFAESGKTFKIDYVSLLSTGGDFSTPQPVVMDNLWRVNVGGRDRMSTASTSERDASPCDGQIFYAPASTAGLSGLYYLNRLYDATSPTDHRDSIYSLSGYSMQLTMMYPWINVHTGQQAVSEAYSSGNSDYATVNLTGDSLIDSGTGYTLNSNVNGYAYPRFDNSYNGVSLVSLTAGGVTVASNEVAGGAIWQWTWNGMQFINDCDYGRQMQTSCFFPYSYNGSAVAVNPTEAGSNYAGRADGSTPVQNLQGSVNFALFNMGNTQISRCVPAEWDTGNVGGGTTNPVLWPGIALGKDVTLNYRGMNHVAKYTTLWHNPTDIATTAANYVQLEVPTVYVRGNFTSYYLYDATGNGGTGQLTSESGTASYGPTYGGVIAATPDSNYAMGIYGVSTTAGGDVGYFTIWDYLYQGETDQFSGSCTKLGTVWQQKTGTFTAGDHTFTTYIVTGTLNDVTSAMQTLYGMRGTIPQ